jgi:elongation factor 1-beta
MSIEESCLAELEKSLANNLFIKGAHPTHDDATTFAKFVEAKCVPDQDKYPSVWAWYSLMVLFEDEVIKSWKPAEKPQEKKGGKGKDHGKKGKEGKKEKEEKEEKKPEKAEEDDMDLFGEETEEEKKAKEEMKQKNKGKKKEKKKPVDKSHVILEIKGWEKDQDLEALAKKIISTIKKDGLQWNTGFKLEEVAFGIKKLVIAFLAEDDKCSVQEITDELESWEDDIQSVEVVSFNKS